MTYSQPFVKVNVEGHFGASSTTFTEFWNTGFHLTKNGGVIGGTSELTSFLTAIRPFVIAYHTTTAVASGTTCFMDAVSGAYIGTDGRYALGSLQSTTRVPLTTVTAGVGTGNAPWTSALVLSLRSLLLRGPASHGRMYWPATAIQVTPNAGTILGTTVNTIATAAKTMLDGINGAAATAFGTGTNIGLVSNKGSGFQSPVTKVGIGQRVDHMESRERNLTESHVFQNLVVSTLLLEQLDDDFRRLIADEFPDADLP